MDLYHEICRSHAEGRACALGLVVATQGSTPQKPGAMALLDDAGRQWGTLGGGLVEAQGVERMRETLRSGESRLAEFRLDEAYARDAGPICGGVMRIAFARPDAAAVSAYEHALRARARGNWGVLVTVLVPEFAAEWLPEHELDDTGAVNPDALAECLRDERPRCVRREDGSEVFLEPVVSVPRLLVVGGGHVGQEVVRQAVHLGFAVTVVDDRPEYASPDLFPAGVDARHGDIHDLVAAFPKGRDAYVVLVSKGHRPDAEALEACIHESVAYLGMIGSERKIKLLRKDFVETKLATAEVFDQVVAPIGIDIGAVTVPEIGVSIAAQLVAARRKGMPLEGSLRLRPRSERVKAGQGES